jgi:hypothetical protein
MLAHITRKERKARPINAATNTASLSKASSLRMKAKLGTSLLLSKPGD